MRNLNDNQGLTLLEVIIVAALMLVIVLPLTSIFVKSIRNIHVVDQLSNTQTQANNALFFIGQDLAGAEEFLFISNTAVIARTYRETTVGFYRNASDNTLRRIRNTTNLANPGEIKARYITDLRFTYYHDTTFRTTLNRNIVSSVRFDVVVDIPASDVAEPHSLAPEGYAVSSLIWARNRATH